MTSYVIRRIVGTIPIVIGISLLVFFIMRMLPGDVALSILGGDEVTNIDPEAVAALRQQLGLDVTIWQQYLTWAGNLLQFDAGVSLWSGKPVFAEIGQRLPLTMGIFAAAVQDTPFDYAVRGFTVLGLAVPAFFLGSVMLLVLTLGLNWAPPLGYVPLNRNPLVNLQQMFWPAFVLGFANAALITRLTRSTMLEVLREGYVRTAKAKGFSDWTILAGHTFRNAVIPVSPLAPSNSAACSAARW